MSTSPGPASGTSRGVLPSGTVTFAFTDIEGSTQRWERDRSAMAQAVRLHDALLRATFTAHGGHIFKTIGDAFCVAFSRPDDALAAVLGAQRALAAHDFAAVGGLRVRAAIHSGSADERDGDYFGPSVNRVARLLAIGHGGQILVSGVCVDLVRGLPPPGATLSDLGRHRLKDLAQPERVFALVGTGLESAFPPLRSIDALPNNLPLQNTELLGREDDVRAVSQLLDTHRVVTVTGAGGVGKTRVALAAGAQRLEPGNDVWFVDLAPLDDGALVPNAVALALQRRLPSGRDPVTALCAALQAERALLILDNCEHLIDAAAGVIGALVRDCVGIVVLATSRQVLQISGEAMYRLPSLEVPQESAQRLGASEALQYAAVALFVARATAVDTRFTLGDANALAVADIVRRLDGIPLAIELAAARTKILSPPQLSSRLKERFRMLTGGSRTALPRQQTLFALIDWSHNLLGDDERVLFRRCAIFAGGWTIESAQAVCGEGFDEFATLDLLESLVEKSLVVVDVGSEAARYRMLESIRAFALERLESTGQFENLARRHARWAMALADVARTRRVTQNMSSWLAALDVEAENLRTAIAWAQRSDEPTLLGHLVGDLLVYWYNRSQSELRVWLQAGVARLDEERETVLAARLWRSIAYVSIGKTKVEAACRAIRLDERTGVHQERAIAYNLAVGGLVALARFDEALAMSDEALTFTRSSGLTGTMSHVYILIHRAKALALYGAAGDEIRALLAEAEGRYATLLPNNEFALAYVRLRVAEVEAVLGSREHALATAEQSEAVARRGADRALLADALRCVATYRFALGAVESAEDAAREALVVAGRIGDAEYVVDILQTLALIRSLRGDVRVAAMLLGHVAARAARDELTTGWLASRTADIAETSLNELLPAQERAWLGKCGAALADSEAVALALGKECEG